MVRRAFCFAAAVILCGAAPVSAVPTAEELLREPDPLVYFAEGSTAGGAAAHRPLSIRTLGALNGSEFTRLIARGVPFLIDDMPAAGFYKMREWSCAWIAKNFGGGRMQMSYMSDANNQDVGDASWADNQQSNGLDDAVVSSGTPKFRPFYWDIKAMRSEHDRPGGWGSDWEEIEAAVLDATRPPGFMDGGNAE